MESASSEGTVVHKQESNDDDHFVKHPVVQGYYLCLGTVISLLGTPLWNMLSSKSRNKSFRKHLLSWELLPVLVVISLTPFAVLFWSLNADGD